MTKNKHLFENSNLSNKADKSDLTVVSGTGNVNADWASGGAGYYKIGKQCVVHAQVTLKQQTTMNNTLLIGGLPLSSK